MRFSRTCHIFQAKTKFKLIWNLTQIYNLEKWIWHSSLEPKPHFSNESRMKYVPKHSTFKYRYFPSATHMHTLRTWVTHVYQSYGVQVFNIIFFSRKPVVIVLLRLGITQLKITLIQCMGSIFTGYHHKTKAPKAHVTWTRYSASRAWLCVLMTVRSTTPSRSARLPTLRLGLHSHLPHLVSHNMSLRFLTWVVYVSKTTRKSGREQG